MVGELRPRRFGLSLLAVAAAVGLGLVSITPVLAATNPTLGELNASNPAANRYAGCVASVLAGNGVTFGSLAALSSDLAAIWPALPAGVADACRQAVDGNQPQVCVNPTNPATCPAVGAATAAAAADLAAGIPGNWKLASDGVGTGGFAQTPLPVSGPPAPVATVMGTFTTPTSVCTSKDCTVPPPPGLWADCGTTTCGQVNSMKVSVIGRTPGGENGVQGHIQLVDGFGNVTVSSGIFGQWYWGTGCGSAECSFTWPATWTCKSGKESPGVVLSPANCGGQSLTVSFTFDGGPGGGCGCASPAPALGQVDEIQLTTDNLNSFQNPTVCGGMFDCMRYDDPRLTYLDGSGRPTVVLNPRPAPSAVINLAASDLGCLVGVDLRLVPAISCLDVTGSSAPLVQTAHALIAPPTITAAATPSGGWQRSPVTVNLAASADPTRSIRSITYSATGAQPAPETVVAGSAAQVVVSGDGVTTLTYSATDSAGTASSAGTITVQVDQTPPAIACAVPSGAWSSSDVTVACTASDPLSGLAFPAQAQVSLITSVPAGTETAAASTGSVTVCDTAGNCATAGPVTGLKVDRLGPSITIAAPTGTYTTGQVVNASYSCADGGSGVASCTGSGANGTAIVTTTAGSFSFTVDATDAAGNHAQRVASYTVTAPPPTPAPGCKPDDGGRGHGDNQSGRHGEARCDEHGPPVEPVASPKATSRPTPRPTPMPSLKPTHGSNRAGNQTEH